MTDAELVEHARRGDRAAFDALVQRYQHVVFRTTLSVTRNRADAEDAAQETFLKAFSRLQSFRGEASVKTWLVAIAWHEGLTRRRSMAAMLRRFVAPADDEVFDPPAPGRLRDAELVDQADAATVRRLVQALPAKYRDALRLAATGDLTFEEMATLTGTPAGTLKWRVAEARRRLKEKLRHLEP